VTRATATAAMLLLAAPVLGQEAPPKPPLVERVYVPEGGFQRVLKKHPRGVVLDPSELDALLERAGSRPAPEADLPPPPVSAVVERLEITGRLEGEVALLEATASVSVLASGTARLRLPLAGTGLRWIRTDGAASASPSPAPACAGSAPTASPPASSRPAPAPRSSSPAPPPASPPPPAPSPGPGPPAFSPATSAAPAP
jgi:hypothetical protein